ncbi:cellulose biosynthesis cyclic di-GMP-binding regulatory protein BcsB [Listeria costaricensis]|uniref:cellulose biosynthesis cyclic di-GMP-binding regulatory protein BcsB n=1 Tax=Listeria costaricensis TaxID=2026604 RepID=UPI000C08C0BE|nr:cellulose biosynthesis cyclic di-GMP-binding regulatory protein BcsB [Listeria costaricensis]
MKKLFLSALLVFAGLFFFQIDTHAADKNYQVVFGTDKEAKGKYTTTNQNFTIEDYWNAESVKVKFVYQITQLTEKEISTITFSINGRPFYSFRPDVTDSGTKEIELDVPTANLKKGSNQLSIEGFVYTNLPDDRCTIDQTPANWLHIDKTTAIDIGYNEEAFQNTIRDFGTRFTGLDTIKEKAASILVSSKKEDAELSGALQALTAFSAENTLDDQNIAFGEYGNTAKQDGKNYQLLFAKYANLPEEIRAQITQTDQLDKEALLKILTMGDTHYLVVTSNSDKALQTAAKLLANHELVSQLSLDEKWVKTADDVLTPVTKTDRTFTLTDAGDKLKGIGHVEQDYFIKMPANRTISGGSKVNLDIRYSQNLDFEHSLVTVLVNGKPVGSQKLSADKANGDTVTLTIPPDMKIIGNFSLTVAFDLVLKDNYCGFINDAEIPWGYITPESNFELHTMEKTDLLFNQYPYPFIQDGTFDETTVIVPDKLDTDTTDALENLFNLLGKFVTGNNGELSVQKSKNFDGENSQQNLIAVGTFKNNQVIKKANDQLYFQYDDKGQYFTSNEKLTIDPTYGERIGSVQLLPSIYQDNFGLLVVTGPTSATTKLGSTLLGTKESLSKIYGDAAIVDQDDTIHAYRFKKAASQETQSFSSKIGENKATLVFVAVAFMAALLLIIAVVLLIRKYRRK